MVTLLLVVLAGCDGDEDYDQDGFVEPADCDDGAFGSHPGAEEVPYDGQDQDCDGADLVDQDEDGFQAIQAGGPDCDDFDESVFPGARDAPYDGFDQDCDDWSDDDFDHDGFDAKGHGGDDCDDDNPAVTPLDLDGDGAIDLVATAHRVLEDDHAAYVLPSQPFPAGVDQNAAWARILTTERSDVGSAGDVDGDGRVDLWVSDSAVIASPRLLVFAGLTPGDHDQADARLNVLGEFGDAVGAAATRLDEALVVGAPGRSSVQLLPADLTGQVLFGEDGARLDSEAAEMLGEALYAADLDADGATDLLVSAPGNSLGFVARVYRVDDPPRSGAHWIEDLADGYVDTLEWAPSASMVLTTGDLDDDGVLDPVIAAPYADEGVGAVGVATGGITGEVGLDDLPIQRLGLGDDTFGHDVEAEDFDGDGHDDLIVGAPAKLGASGGADKPGAVHLWYGPLEPSIEHTFTADLFVQGAYNGYRAHTGEALVVLDADLDGGVDLLIASPYYEAGVVDLLSGGFTGLYGM